MVMQVNGLPASQLKLRAARIRLVVSDVDGVLTDGGVYYSERGEELKRFSVRDGMGVERLRADGVETALLTRENSAVVARRAEKLQIERVYLGVRDKQLFLREILGQTGIDLDQVAYIGDDVNDAEVMALIASRGLVGAPADAYPQILALAHLRGTVNGGAGAFREFAEWLLELRQAARSIGSSRPTDGTVLRLANAPALVKESDT